MSATSVEPVVIPLPTHFAVEAKRGENVGDVVRAICRAGKTHHPWFRRLEWLTEVRVLGHTLHRFRSDVSPDTLRAMVAQLCEEKRAVLYITQAGTTTLALPVEDRVYPASSAPLFTYERKNQWALYRGPKVRGWETGVPMDPSLLSPRV